jgi:oligoribonuclease
MTKPFEDRAPIKDPMLWLDLETTGSSCDKGDEIIEVGCVLTTSDMEELGEFSSVVKPGPHALGRMMQNTIVREMHTKNGLLAEVLNADDSLKINKVTDDLLSWMMKAWLGRPMRLAVTGRGSPLIQPGTLILAGSGVGHFDRKFIDKYMPQLSKMLRYWCIDIGTIRRAHDMWVGTTVSVENDNKTHRAIDDAYCHLREARAFRTQWTTVPEGTCI